MIKSMTGFGRCEYQQDSRKFTAELKSVNHRYSKNEHQERNQRMHLRFIRKRETVKKDGLARKVDPDGKNF